MTTSGYIGFTSKTVEGRWTQHKNDAKRYPHLTFYKALVKYGDRIIVTTLLEGSDQYCLDIENRLRPTAKIGWNIKVGGDFGSIGVTASDETKRKLSECRIGEKNHFFGKTHSDEQKACWRESRKGAFVSEETRKRQSEIRLGKKLNLSDEQRRAASLRSSARKNSPETRVKISLAAAGRYIGWRSPLASGVWLIAVEVFEHMALNPEHGVIRAAKHFSYSGNQMKTLFKKIRSGWIPLEDSAYTEWLLEKTTKPEAQFAT